MLKKIILKALEIIKKNEFWLGLAFLIFFLGRFPSLFEPLWYLDENIYLIVGREISQGEILYLQAWDHKPPLIFLLNAFSYGLFGPVIWPLKLLSLILGLLEIYLIYFLSKSFLKVQPLTSSLAAFIFSFLRFGLFEATIANAEQFFSPLILLGLTGILFGLKKNATKPWFNLVLGSMVWSFAGFFKFHALLEVLALVGLFLICHGVQNIKILNLNNIQKYIQSRNFKKFILIGFIIFLPYLLTYFYYYNLNAISDLNFALFEYNQTYIKTESEFLPSLFFWQIEGISGITFRILVFLIFIFFNFFFYLKKNINKSFFIINGWLSSVFFAALLSERNYGHYLYQILPATAFWLVLNFKTVFQEKTFDFIKFVEKSVFLGLVLQTFFLSFNYGQNNQNWAYYKVREYYKDFYSQIWKGDIESWQSKHFNQDFDLQNLLVDKIQTYSQSEEEIFIFAPLENLYLKSQRGSASRFIFGNHYRNFLNSTAKEISNNQASLILIDNKEPDTEIFKNLIQENFYQQEKIQDRWEIWLPKNI